MYCTFTINVILFADHIDNTQAYQPSPRLTSADVPGLADCYLWDEAKLLCEVGTLTNPSTKIWNDNFIVKIQNLPEKIGFPLSSMQK